MDFLLRDFRYPVAIWRLRRELERSQWLPPERHSEFQWERLRGILIHAFQNIPFYRRRFEAEGVDPYRLRDLSDYHRIPVLTKDDIRASLPEMLAVDARRYAPKLSHTGGTTGTAMDFYVDRASNIAEFAFVWRHWNWAGYRFGDRFCDLRGRIIRAEKPWVYDPRLNALFLSSYRLTRELVRDYAARLRRFRPRIIRGYPSAIDIFARLLREQGIDDVRPTAVVTSSETLLAHQRANLEEVFGCPVFDTYGLEERVAAAGQCEAGRLHEDAEYGFISYVDDGSEVPEGETGELVCTGFHNYAMPFIRYRTNDLARRAKEACPCGRGLPVIESIEGRVEDMVVTPDGRYVSGAGLSVALKYSAGIRLSQIVQDRVDEVTVRIVRSLSYGRHDEDTLLRRLRDRVGEVIRIRIEYVDSLELTRAGKLKFVVSRVPPDVR